MRKEVTVSEWLKGAKREIDSLDAELLALHCFTLVEVDRSWLVAHEDMVVGPVELEMANDYLERRKQGVPLAYLTGEKEFYGRIFAVEEGATLIPRPETEALIDLVKRLPLPRAPRILDLGTGSGCIAITLALEIPRSRVMGSDVSLDALEWASINNRQLEGRVELVESDLFEDVSLTEDGPFDVVVANLPYVNPEWDWVDKKALSLEPKGALYEKRMKGLGMYHDVVEYLADLPGLVKYLVVEADPCQHDDLIEMMGEFYWTLENKEGYGLAFRYDPPEVC